MEIVVSSRRSLLVTSSWRLLSVPSSKAEAAGRACFHRLRLRLRLSTCAAGSFWRGGQIVVAAGFCWTVGKIVDPKSLSHQCGKHRICVCSERIVLACMFVCKVKVVTRDAMPGIRIPMLRSVFEHIGCNTCWICVCVLKTK